MRVEPLPARPRSRAIHRLVATALAVALGGCGGSDPSPTTPTACVSYQAPVATGTGDPDLAVFETSDLERFLSVLAA
jgi:hypothetical protein